MTNAKITATYLQAQKPETPFKDERQYRYPDRLLREYIPNEVFNFFDRMKDKSIPSEEVFNAKLNIMVGDCPCTVAYGGIHGAIPTYMEEANDTRMIRNKDVASYYPHLMTLPLNNGWKVGYCSRAIPDPQIFINALDERVAAKEGGR